MKTSFLIFLLFLLFVGYGLQAQTIDEKEVKTQIEQEGFGIKGGMVGSNLTPSVSTPYRFSYQAGLVWQFKLGIESKNFGLAEVLFSKEGTGPTSSGVVLYNILIPILYKRNMNHWLAFEAGPQLSININDAFDTNWSPSKKLWYNAAIGGSAYLTNRNYINFRFSKGLGPVYTNPNYSSIAFALSFINVF